MENYRYSQTWFLDSEIKQILLNYINPYSNVKVLEIGCFEGLSSVFFADNLLNHIDSTLTCVDPFLNGEYNDHSIYLQKNEENNFDYNIKNCKNVSKINVNKITSDKFFETNQNTFNFIYIDGCHEPDFITRDMENSFKFLERGGIMWMDDYRGGQKMSDAMDKFLEKYKGKFIILHKSYQLAIRKC